MKKPPLKTNKMEWRKIQFNSSVQRYWIYEVITQGAQQQVGIWKREELFYHNGVTVNHNGICDRGVIYAVDM